VPDIFYLPLYVSDYEADTAHLTIEEDGAYMRLLRLCWRTPTCSIPNDAEWIARRMRCSMSDFERLVQPILSEFFVLEKGRYTSLRLLREMEKVQRTRDSRKQAGSKGGKAKALKSQQDQPSKAKDLPVAKPKHLYLELESVDTSVSTHMRDQDFEEFWNQYPHRGGAKKGKSEARKSWDRAIKLKTSKAEIISGALRYGQDRQVLSGYAKDPSTWLNQRGWEDDVEADQPKQTAKSDTERRLIDVAARTRFTPNDDLF
jgi:uncharacterized protein YdaU (DUF1376 family)